MATSLTNKLDFGTGGSKVSASNDTLTWGWTRTWTMDTDEGNDQSPASLHKYNYGEADPS
jgi:hypothetical protein